MKKSLSHLPPHKRDELHLVVDLILQKVPDAQMIILFGSHARGDWVEDVYKEGHITYEYRSDFDILVIVESPAVAHRMSVWRHLRKKAADLPITTSANIIAHDIEDVNGQLAKAHYFFTDIKKEGVLLYDSGKFKLARIRKLDPRQRAGIARVDFKEWFTSAKGFERQFEHAFKDREYKIAAFELHQATERFYTTVLLVFTHYKAKDHDLEVLGRRAASCDPSFLTVFPQATDKQKHCFDLLRRAYVDARYNPRYKITRAELKYLSERVAELRKLTRRICKKKIESFV